MDIHRCRFVPYQPSSINALAFSHSSDPKQKAPSDLRLALGRENGDIEIWNPLRGLWHQERIFRGGVGRTIEQLQWTQEIVIEEDDDQQEQLGKGPLRLYSSGGSPSITEWDIERGIPKRHADGNKGDIWCIAAQPQWTPAQQKQQREEVKKSPAQLVAAGCVDGSIVIFSTADDDLQYDRVLVQPLRKRSKVISITWKDRDTVVAGYEESIIRVIDVRSRRVLRNITLGKSSEGEPAVVWTVKCLPNGTILSGDSTGELKIWDSHNYSLVQRLKTHNADVLDITTNAAGTAILTCGVDRRTVAYALRSDTMSSRTQRWQEIRHRRFHEHDVKTITSFESKELSLAISGGMDTVPVVVPLQNGDDEYHRSLPYLPQKPQMSVSPTTRLMLSWWGRSMYIWNLPAKRTEAAEGETIFDDQLNHKLLAQIQLKEDEFLTSAEIAISGDMVIAATNDSVKLFQIRKTVSRDGDVEVRFRSLKLPHTMASQGASKVGFSPDSKWLYAIRLTNIVSLARISPAPSAKDRPSILDQVIKLDRKRRTSTPSTGSKLENYSKYIGAVAFSSDSRILAVGDLSGSISTWILNGHESGLAQSRDHKQVEDFETDSDSDSDSDSDDETDSKSLLGQRWMRIPGGHQLPQLESAILVLSFKPTTSSLGTANKPIPLPGDSRVPAPGHLVAITSSHEVIEFDVRECQISDWSRQNPTGLFPASFRLVKDRVMGVWWHCTRDFERLWMYGEGFVYMIDTSQDVDPTKDDTRRKKRRVGMMGNHIVEAPEDHALQLLDNAEKMESTHSSKKRKRKIGGAGDEMRPNHKYAVKLQKVDDSLDQAGLLSPPESVVDHADTDEDIDMLNFEDIGRTEDKDLVILRRRGRPQPHDDVGQYEVGIDRSETRETNLPKDEGIVQNRDGESNPASWHTFQYRGMFGAGLLQQQQDLGDKESEAGTGVSGLGPEVVIVERPMYDVELLPRFTNGQEW